LAGVDKDVDNPVIYPEHICPNLSVCFHLRAHWRDQFGRPLPDIPEVAKVVIDPGQGAEMIGKLLDMQLLVLAAWSQDDQAKQRILAPSVRDLSSGADNDL
jgi:hypothetical protein